MFYNDIMALRCCGINVGLCTASFIAVDKLQIAEDLVRRTLAKEVETDGKQHPNSRKLLADILNQQN